MQFKKYRIMKKSLYAAILATVLFSSCANEFNRVYKTSDNTYKYEYAKESYANGKYVRASSLLQGLVTMQKGTDNAQESLYMLAMAEYNSKDYEGAAATFKKYFQSYPKGVYAEKAIPTARIVLLRSRSSSSCRTNWCRKNSTRLSSTTTSVSTSATAHTEVTTTRLASSLLRTL